MKRLHGLGANINLNHEALTIMASSTYNIESLSQLSDKELADFVSWLSGKVKSSKKWSKQDRRIFAIAYQLKWSTEAIRNFIRRQTGKNDLVLLTPSEKNKVINGLLAIGGNHDQPSQ